MGSGLLHEGAQNNRTFVGNQFVVFGFRFQDFFWQWLFGSGFQITPECCDLLIHVPVEQTLVLTLSTWEKGRHAGAWFQGSGVEQKFAEPAGMHAIRDITQIGADYTRHTFTSNRMTLDAAGLQHDAT